MSSSLSNISHDVYKGLLFPTGPCSLHLSFPGTELGNGKTAVDSLDGQMHGPEELGT